MSYEFYKDKFFYNKSNTFAPKITHNSKLITYNS